MDQQDPVERGEVGQRVVPGHRERHREAQDGRTDPSAQSMQRESIRHDATAQSAAQDFVVAVGGLEPPTRGL